MSNAWRLPRSAFCPQDPDLPRYEEIAAHAGVKYAIASELRPSSILEIGVRCGYSAFAFLSACPWARYLGIDAENGQHGGAGGPWGHWAQRILAAYDVELIRADSQVMDELPPGPGPNGTWDLVHVDGDHTTAGALHDMHLCWQKARIAMLVDDYDFLPTVRLAVDQFVLESGVIRVEHRKSLRGEMLFVK